MGDPAEYLAAIEAALVESPIIADFKVVNQKDFDLKHNKNTP